MKMKISVKAKILILIIPLLLCSFSITSTVVIKRSQRFQINVTSDFLKYKLEHIAQYAAGQWHQMLNYELDDNETIYQFVIESISGYASTAIERGEEYILVYDEGHNLVFQIGGLSPDWTELKPESYYNSALNTYNIAGEDYIGISRDIAGMNWDLIVVEHKSVFDGVIKRITTNLLIIFTGSFLVIIFSLVVVLSIILNPINQVRTAIQKIISDRVFSHTVPVRSADEIGELSISFNNLITSTDLFLKKLRRNAEDEAIRNKELLLREIENLELLGRVSDYKDINTGSHVRRVSAYSRIIAAGSGFDEEYLDLVYYSSLLHDIGKVGTPDSILLKQGKLTDEEFSIMKEHTTIGYNILNNFSSKYLKAGAVIAYSHHEKFDGSGYPRGLRGDEIPQFGRIVSIADVFDALTTERPYKKAWTTDEAFDLIEQEKGRQFDPALAELFLKRKEDIVGIFNSTKEK